ncbi:MAG: glyoxalase/bleomycin resistance/dioxygenase family protein [SAR324 cluster bacterium]|uniref:Glyoxalase/bleomycin resistance/dioxygenase family protein n=1 Tax=SAR324 cluster bacterium TaxID=2024889 RepID=A0A2A4T6X7_9DELT|nr:MAG: glyoxalase/bleomycin resistance/dioxygenase family protein [SAR324 cluster bacterium]
MNPRITHIALHIQNLDDCIHFYQNFCQMHVIHQREQAGRHTVWLAEEGREKDFIFVLLSGGQKHEQPHDDYSHFGFAVESRAAVDQIAIKARQLGCLFWEPMEEPYPVGYYCGVRDPDGNFVEFSFGQPLGPGAE